MKETVLITGGTGSLGRVLWPRLLEAGYQVRIGSRRAAPAKLADGVSWAQMDLATGEGVETAVSGVHKIIHAASSPFSKTNETDVVGAERLLNAAPHLNNFFYISIVGIDKIPYRYYQHKLATEHLIAKSSAPWTILRATQFHSLLDMSLSGLAKLPVLLLPKNYTFQPIATAEVVAEMVAAVVANKTGRLPDLAGPERLSVDELAQAWLQARGLKKPIWHLPLRTKAAQGFLAGHHTLPERPFGKTTWREWLAAKYGAAVGL